MRLLIVEDDWLVAEFIATVAVDLGIEVISIVQSYDEAKSLLESQQPDCAVVDINIKGARHGIDVARMLKEKGVEFLFLTAYKDIETITEATELHPLSYVIKPASEADISAALMIAKKKIEVAVQTPFAYSVTPEGCIARNGEIIVLSFFERTAFALLIANVRNVVPHETFFAQLWENPEEISEGTLRNVIGKLRKKLDVRIENVKNMGYVLLH